MLVEPLRSVFRVLWKNRDQLNETALRARADAIDGPPVFIDIDDDLLDHRKRSPANAGVEVLRKSCGISRHFCGGKSATSRKHFLRCLNGQCVCGKEAKDQADGGDCLSHCCLPFAWQRRLTSCCAAGPHDGEKWYDASGPSAPAKVRQLHGAGVLMLTSRSRSKPSRRS